MKRYDSCVRAFIKGNLGDDLFIHTLCKRYPHRQFVLGGEKQYAEMFSEYKNLKYVSTDAFFHKWIFRVLNIPAYANRAICKVTKKKATVPNYRFLEHFSRHSEYNVLISGSIFMEADGREFTVSPYMKNEKRYFEEKPVVLGCNFGPYHSKAYYEFYDECFKKARQVSFRDRYSHSLFVKDNTLYAPDILFAYEKSCCILPEEKDYILISAMNLLKDFAEDVSLQTSYETGMVKLIDSLVARKEKIVLMGFCNAQGDDNVIASIYGKLKNKTGVKCVNYPDITYKEAVGYIAGAKAVIATRYHAMILGWLYEKPVLPIVYNEKMTHVIEDLGNEHPYVTVEQLRDNEADLLAEYEKVLKKSYLSDLSEIIRLSKGHFKALDEIYEK